eukprot:6480684-Amphidinium_carterae.1
MKAVLDSDEWAVNMTQKYISHFEALYSVPLVELRSSPSLEMMGKFLKIDDPVRKVSATMACWAPQVYQQLLDLKSVAMQAGATQAWSDTSLASSYSMQLREITEEMEYSNDSTLKRIKVTRQGVTTPTQRCGWPLRKDVCSAHKSVRPHWNDTETISLTQDSRRTGQTAARRIETPDP